MTTNEEMTMDYQSVKRLKYDKGAQVALKARQEIQDRSIELDAINEEIKKCKIGIKTSTKLIQKNEMQLRNEGLTEAQKQKLNENIKRVTVLLADFKRRKKAFEEEKLQIVRTMGVLQDISNAKNPEQAQRRARSDSTILIGGIRLGTSLRPGHRVWSFMYE